MGRSENNTHRQAKKMGKNSLKRKNKTLTRVWERREANIKVKRKKKAMAMCFLVNDVGWARLAEEM